MNVAHWLKIYFTWVEKIIFICIFYNCMKNSENKLIFIKMEETHNGYKDEPPVILYPST
jgi:hypothetical protein